VIKTLAEVMQQRGVPQHIRSDHGPEFVARELRQWLGNVGCGTLYIEPGSPWENGYCESFNGKLGDEGLNGEIFYSRKEAQIVIESWRNEYNTVGRIRRLATDHRRYWLCDCRRTRLWTAPMQYKLSHSAWYKKIGPLITIVLVKRY